MYKVVLASQSPRRKQLLEQIGVEFDIWPSKKEEVVSSSIPSEVCVELCKQKALDVASQIVSYNEEHKDITTAQDILVIGADTIVAMPVGIVEADENPKNLKTSENVEAAKTLKTSETVEAVKNLKTSETVYEILGKPKTESEAFDMLCKLRNAKHTVFTGVSFVFISKEGRVGEYSFYEATDVFFGPIEDDEIKEYIATGEPMDKAGAYGIQGAFAKYIKGINGDFYNVMGLPVSRICYELKSLGVSIN